MLVREWEDQVGLHAPHRAGAGRQELRHSCRQAAGVPRSVIHRAEALLNQLVVHVGKVRPRAAATQVQAIAASSTATSSRLWPSFGPWI